MSKQILMLVGDYAEDYETMVPFQFLTALGINKVRFFVFIFPTYASGICLVKYRILA